MIKKIGDTCLTALIRFAYFIWACATHIIYLPKITYLDKQSKEKLKKPCILIANHTSHTDGSFIPQIFPGKKINVLVTTKWYNKKYLNVFFSHLRYIPINLNEVDNSWMERAQKVLEKGETILIFPEGKLSKDGNVGEFLPGFLLLARHTDVPVIPLAIKGGYKKFSRQQVIVGSEIAFDVHAKGRPSAILKEGAIVCRKQIVDMLANE